MTSIKPLSTPTETSAYPAYKTVGTTRSIPRSKVALAIGSSVPETLPTAGASERDDPADRRESAPAAAAFRLTSRQRAVQLSQRLNELEAENLRLRDEVAQWSMHHAHAASGIQRVRDALATGTPDPEQLIAILNEGEVDSGTSRFVASIVDDLVADWTRHPIPTVTRSAVRDWLIAHRTLSR